jgi:MerR family transcriptional regulator, thiopeptide resistance regulator
VAGMRTVGEVAQLTGVTIRTLHHYDEIGLLSPSERSEAGYRLYSYDDLTRLQEIIGWRTLGFSLAEISELLDEPRYDRGHALERQRALIDAELGRLSGLARAINAALEAHRAGTRLEETTMFDGFDASEYEDEARERWGHTDAYRESARRTAGYGETEWAAIRTEFGAIVAELAALLRSGEPAGGEQARAVAERHRQHISQWFYPCAPEMHRALGEMYVSDQRFTRNWDSEQAGLAEYARDAIAANADTQGQAVIGM